MWQQNDAPESSVHKSCIIATAASIIFILWKVENCISKLPRWQGKCILEGKSLLQYCAFTVKYNDNK